MTMHHHPQHPGQAAGRDHERPTALPAPHRAHATCAWCRVDFTTIRALLDHVDGAHAALPPLAA